MNKFEKAVTGLIGLVAVELAVLDYAAWMAIRNGLNVEISEEELVEAGEQAFKDMEGE